ncbi:MAG TPA: DUF2905 domain-containing protein [Acidimicrobiales bacterium]|jgi:hypothetical protein|nr:DUF2905 domain-containing protein [Acidimicrobiales bacterium]
MDVSTVGRLLVAVGIVTALVGGLLIAGSRLGLGRLPGDFTFSWGNVRVFAPLATGLLLSIVLTIVLNLFLRR